MKKLNIEDAPRLFKLAEEYQSKNLRAGQSLMNALFEISPELYKEITDTDSDCFFIDSRTLKFLNRIFNHES